MKSSTQNVPMITLRGRNEKHKIIISKENIRSLRDF